MISLILIFLSGFSDPGMMKRNRNIGDCHQNAVKTVHKGVFKKIKICSTCKMAKPFRSAHCADCDNCVIKFDHHCPWIGNCVGRRNYIYFYYFVFFLNLSNLFILGLCVTHIVIEFMELSKNEKEKNNYIAMTLCNCIISLFCILYIICEMMFTSGLLIYHTILICKNMTTKEELKKLLHSKIGNYYDRGIRYNCWNFLNRKIPQICTLDELNKYELVKNDKVNIEPYKGDRDSHDFIHQLRAVTIEEYEERKCNTSYKNIKKLPKEYNKHNHLQTSINDLNYSNTGTSDNNSQSIELRDLTTSLSIPQENFFDAKCNISQ